MPEPTDPDQRASPARTGGLSADEAVRYSRHLMLPEIGLEGQHRLKQSRVLIVGAGGLGSPAAIYLATAGIGTLGLADFDRVEAHNLQRQILHRENDVGRPKTDSGRDMLVGLNPQLRVNIHPEGINAGNAAALFADYDVIVDGSDNFPTRYLNADAAHLTRRPLVYGSVFRFQGQVSLFDTRAGGPCYRCLFPRPPEGEAVPNCAEAGVLGALCGLIGSLQAIEAIKVLLGVGQPLAGRLLIVDALEMHFQTLQITRNPTCILCSNAPTITSLSAHRPEADGAPERLPPWPGELEPTEVIRHLRNDPTACVLDVREPFERAICRIESSIDLPMGQVPLSLDSIPGDRTIFVLCHHGQRSGRVVQFLRSRGYDRVINIRGGIDAWSRSVDPEMARY